MLINLIVYGDLRPRNDESASAKRRVCVRLTANLCPRNDESVSASRRRQNGCPHNDDSVPLELIHNHRILGAFIHNVRETTTDVRETTSSLSIRDPPTLKIRGNAESIGQSSSLRGHCAMAQGSKARRYADIVHLTIAGSGVSRLPSWITSQQAPAHV
jgi:hypothetical protein